MCRPVKKDVVLQVVKKYIDELNPYMLLPDAPADEFDSESQDMANRIDQDMSVEQIAVVIADVLNRSFDENFSPDRYREVASLIFNKVRQLYRP